MKKRYEMQVFLDGIRQAKAYHADNVNEFAETVEFFSRYLSYRFTYKIRTTSD